MAKLDKFLIHLANKGASSLLLEPGGYPTLEFPGGHRVNLSLQELLGTVLDGLVKEILPPGEETNYLRGEKVLFPYKSEDGSYYLAVVRTTMGARVIATLAPPPETLVPLPPPPPAPEVFSKTESIAPPPPTVVAGPASVFELLVSHLLSTGSSDLYLSSDEPPMLRTHGKVHTMPGFPVPRAQDIAELIKAIAPSKAWEDFKRDQTAEFIHLDRPRQCRLRISLFEDGQGPGASVRVIPHQLPNPESLGFPEPLIQLSELNKGLVLFAGTAGSGRTTTVMALLERIAHQRQCHILSIESTVEFPITSKDSLVRQREVGGDLERHKKTVRAGLKQSPDLLSMGEILDAEMADLALDAASSGRVVFAMVPAVSALDGLQFLSQLPPTGDHSLLRMRLANTLKAVVCQTLLPGQRGGRVAVFETLFVSPTIAEHIREGRISQIPAAMKTGRAYGQRLMNESMVELIQQRMLDPMEAYNNCLDRDGFITACKKGGVNFDPRKMREG
jgi:twitching motility protein PilT